MPNIVSVKKKKVVFIQMMICERCTGNFFIFTGSFEIIQNGFSNTRECGTFRCFNHGRSYISIHPCAFIACTERTSPFVLYLVNILLHRSSNSFAHRLKRHLLCVVSKEQPIMTSTSTTSHSGIEYRKTFSGTWRSSIGAPHHGSDVAPRRTAASFNSLDPVCNPCFGHHSAA